MTPDKPFHSEFLAAFPPVRSYHDRVACSQQQKGCKWSVDEKNVICAEVNENGATVVAVSSYLQVKPSRIYKILKIKKGGRAFHEIDGRPSKLDGFAREEVHESVDQAAISMHPMRKYSDLYPMLIKKAEDTDLRRGGCGVNVHLSTSTMKREIKGIGITFEQGQTTTEARAREKRDLRNMISMAAANHAFGKDKPIHLIGNFDATQFVISENNNELLAKVVKRDDPLTLTETHGLEQGIKWFMLCNAAGTIGCDCFIIADPTMEAEDFKSYNIMGLSHCNMSGASGYLCVTRRRCANLKFFTWYLTEIVIPFTKTSRQYIPEDQRDMGFYLVADGEEIQIKPVESESVCNLLNDAKIDFIKCPASCTGTVGNACDQSHHLFKATKKTLKGSQALLPSDFEDPSLQRLISDILRVNHTNIYAEKRRVLSKGLVIRIVRSLSIVMNHKIVARGFERIGVAPLDAMRCFSNCAIDVLEKIGSQGLNNIADKVPDLATHFLNNDEGQLTELVMDDAEIPRFDTGDRRTKDKDERTQSHQRAVVLNSDGARQRRKAWLETQARRQTKRNIASSEVNITADGEKLPLKKAKVPRRSSDVIQAENKEKTRRKAAKDAAKSLGIK